MRVFELPTGSTPAMLHCCTCGSDYSANRGDYFMRDPTHIMKCHGRNLQLVIRQTIYVEFQSSIAACRKGR